MIDEPYGVNFWQAKLNEAERRLKNLPRWRWLARSNQLEAVRACRQVLLAELKGELHKLTVAIDRHRRDRS